MKNAILMSIRPQYAKKIFDGTKTVELRRVKPKSINKGDLIYIYVSTPIKSLMGAFTVSSVTEEPLVALWKNVKDQAGIKHHEFVNYFHGADIGVAIFIKDVWLLPRPVHLTELKKEMAGFCAPQSFRYTSVYQMENFQ
jgi:predicted transcriptional regulator